MSKNLYSFYCKRCSRSYCSKDCERIYCSSDCEAKDKYEDLYCCEKKYDSKKSEKLNSEELTFDYKPNKETQRILSINQRWLNRKTASEKPRQDLNKIRYADTFKKFIPKSLRVMRG